MVSYELIKKINEKKLTKVCSQEEKNKAAEWLDRAMYFKGKLDLIEQRIIEDEKSAILKGAFNMFGQKNKELKEAYLKYANEPCSENWINFRSFILLGNKTAWQIWCENDIEAPRSGESDIFPAVEEFEKYYAYSVDLEKNNAEKEYFKAMTEYYSVLYKGFVVKKNLMKNPTLINEVGEKIFSDEYENIIEVIKKEYSMNNVFFVADEITHKIYIGESLKDYINTEI